MPPVFPNNGIEVASLDTCLAQRDVYGVGLVLYLGEAMGSVRRRAHIAVHGSPAIWITFPKMSDAMSTTLPTGDLPLRFLARRCCRLIIIAPAVSRITIVQQTPGQCSRLPETMGEMPPNP